MSQFCLFVFVLQPDSFWIKLNTALALVSKPTCHNYDSSQFCLFLHLRLTALVQNQRHTQYSSDVCLFFRLGLHVTVIVQKRHSGFSSLQTSQHVKTRQISVRCFVIVFFLQSELRKDIPALEQTSQHAIRSQTTRHITTRQVYISFRLSLLFCDFFSGCMGNNNKSFLGPDWQIHKHSAARDVWFGKYCPCSAY